MPDFAEFTNALLAWYRQYGRKLPWRETQDPYRIWISEVMLQQTQVPRVQNYFYPRFLERFPSIEALSQESWDDVYPFWKGLGYYSRGKNLLKASQMIVRDFGGKFPENISDLQKLPGVGFYTACAILAFAFDKKIAAIDTNISQIIRTLWPEKNEEEVALELVWRSDSGRDWNNAMMDLGTALRENASLEGEIGRFFPPEIRQQFRPGQVSKNCIRTKKRPRIEVGIACIHKDGKYLIQSRPLGKSFTGFWEFPGGKREKGEDLRACVKREIMEELGIEISVRPYFFEQVHHFEKLDLVLRFHRCQIQAGTPKPIEGQKLQWVSPSEFLDIQFLETNREALLKLQKMKV